MIYSCFVLFCSRDAWNKLGDMSKEEAMNCYVDELKNVCGSVYVVILCSSVMWQTPVSATSDILLY